MTRAFSIVVAADAARGIGKTGGLPWRLPGEMAYFRRLTRNAPEGKRNAVIMGRKTYASIAPRFRPLDGRVNVVLTRDSATSEFGVLIASGLEHALELVTAREDVADIFVIGGASVYAEALQHPGCERVYITRVHAALDCDAFLAPFEDRFLLVSQDGPHEEGDLRYTFEVYQRAARSAS